MNKIKLLFGKKVCTNNTPANVWRAQCDINKLNMNVKTVPEKKYKNL